jgi:hypothetical protein
MNQEIRNKLRNVVTQCRKLLEDSVSQELEGKYGIFAKKDQVTADPKASMAHLTEEEHTARKDILDHFGHIKARGFKSKDALDQLVREIAFTHLNRLCAYKMMEAREVYVGEQKFREAVSRGINSNGVKFYLADHAEEERLFNTGQQDVAYRHFLDWLGGLLSDEIGVLFNPNDPANRLYPRQKTLDAVLELLNGGGIKPDETELRESWPKIWSQDETIGWVYQYFTPKELRDQARKESQAPRNSYELAFRNQFFTPRYVVEFLTDNTLGRIWYEMRKGDTKLKDQCRYMVRRPAEVFLQPGEQPPEEEAERRDNISQEELLKLPVHIPHRSKKDPRELKVLDPACGSGHFLLYCFDLLQTIYAEAYADPELGPALQTEYPSLEDLRRDTPRLILACNLHGIDIDLRASQIAALALWLRCQRAYRDMGLKKDHPKITRSNFVCAEPMPGEEQMLKEFVGQLEPKLLGQIVEVVFEKMRLAGEAGSLLKIEEGIRDAVSESKKQWAQETIHATDRKGQPLLFSKATMERLAGKPEQSGLFDLGDITDAQFFEEAEAKVLEALRRYAEKAHGDRNLPRKLFTDDAVRGFAFVDVCQKRYDAVLMNPPYGAPTTTTKRFHEEEYPATKSDVYASFIERSCDLCIPDGLIGALTDRMFLMLPGFTKFRQDRLLSSDPIILVADLWYDVLDGAFNCTAASVIRARSTQHSLSSVFFDLKPSQDRQADLLRMASSMRSDRIYCHHNDRFISIPEARFSYWLPELMLRTFSSLPSFEPSYGVVKVGIQTCDDFRFLRLWWESPIGDAGWCSMPKGGDFSPFYRDTHLVIDWHANGAAMRRYIERDLGRGASRHIQNQNYYGTEGLTYPHVAGTFNVQHMPAGQIFSIKGPGIFVTSQADLWIMLAFLNSLPAKWLLSAISGGHSWDTKCVAAIPIPPLSHEVRGVLSESAARAVELLQAWESHDETSHNFCRPFASLHWHRHNSLQGVEKERVSQGARAAAELKELLKTIDAVCWKAYAGEASPRAMPNPDRFDESGYINIESYWDTRHSALSTLFSTSSRDEVVGLISEALGDVYGRFAYESHRGDPPRVGIISDDPNHQHDVSLQIREILERAWKERTDAIEREACRVLGVKELRDYFRKTGKGGFWDDHIARYSKSRRKAPIYWLLQSSKKNYALWLYYHRLDKDLLFKALVNYVEPKIRLETSRLETVRSQMMAAGESSKEGKRLSKEIEWQEDFLSELRDFEDKLRRAANLHLEPDLNHGVVLNIAPLRELVPWKEAKNYWDELLEGKYEWSSIGKQLRQKGLVK